MIQTSYANHPLSQYKLFKIFLKSLVKKAKRLYNNGNNNFYRKGVKSMKQKHSYQYTFRSLLIRRMFISLLLLAQLLLIAVSVVHYSKMRWVAALLRGLAVLTALHLLTHRRPASFKISMVFLILLFPLFGGVFYWIFHFQTTTVGFRRALQKVQKDSETLYRRSDVPFDRAATQAPESAKLIHYLDTVPQFPAYERTQTVFFTDGKEFQADLLNELKQARHYIFLEFFIIGEGVFWDSVLEVLRERVHAGVDVRVIYDDLGCFATLPHRYKKKLQSYGISCRVFNPFRPFLTSIQNNRDHRKIAIIDGKIAFTGGMNLADEYINERERFGHWKDSAIKLSGNGAWSFTVMFLQMWSFLTSKPVDWDAYIPSFENTSSPECGLVQPFSDSPMDREAVAEQVYLQIINNARNYLYITTPYFMVDDNMQAALKCAAKSGVDVRMILPHRPDKPMVHFTTRSYYRELLSAGIKIYEYSDGFIHSKNMVADDLVACVGSVNLDFRSLYMHFECGTCLYRTPSIPCIREDFLQTLEHCQPVTVKDCKVGPIKKLLQDICRLFAPMM